MTPVDVGALQARSLTRPFPLPVRLLVEPALNDVEGVSNHDAQLLPHALARDRYLVATRRYGDPEAERIALLMMPMRQAYDHMTRDDIRAARVELRGAFANLRFERLAVGNTDECDGHRALHGFTWDAEAQFVFHRRRVLARAVHRTLSRNRRYTGITAEFRRRPQFSATSDGLDEPMPYGVTTDSAG